MDEVFDQRLDGRLGKACSLSADNLLGGGAKPVDKFLRTGPLYLFDLRLRLAIDIYGQPSRQAGFRPDLQALATPLCRVWKTTPDV
jgi:hypothetical protein